MPEEKDKPKFNNTDGLYSMLAFAGGTEEGARAFLDSIKPKEKKQDRRRRYAKEVDNY